MGWWNNHLHQFIKDRKYYLEKTEENDFWDNLIHVVENPGYEYRRILP